MSINFAPTTHSAFTSQYTHTQNPNHSTNSLLTPLPNDGHSLAVLSPGNVTDLPGKRLVLVLQQVLLLGGVPDADLSGYICQDLQ